MKVLVGHTRFQWYSGADAAYEADVRLLERAGHDVVRIERDNDEIADFGPAAKAGLAAGTVWSAGAYRAVGRAIASVRPDVVHFHNTFPLLSPAVDVAAHRAGVPVVRTLHDFRLACPNGLLFRDGHACEDCVGRGVTWPGIVHRCYRRSAPQTAVVSTMLAAHRAAGTWRRAVDVFVTVSSFQRDRVVLAGVPAERVVVRPNVVDPDPGARDPDRDDDGSFVFVGRLAPEKGVADLVAAAERVPDARVVIAGDGPLRDTLARDVAGRRLDNVAIVGPLARADLIETVRRARALVSPSISFETFGLAIAEAFACGVPVVTTALGGPADIVDDGRTGWHVPVGDPAALAGRLTWLSSHPDQARAAGRAARVDYERRFSPAAGLASLVDIYALASERAARRA